MLAVDDRSTAWALEFFWKWRRSHHPSTEASLSWYFGNLLRPHEVGTADLGIFSHSVVERKRARRSPSFDQKALPRGVDAFSWWHTQA
jgi:hypothetical protein